MVSKDFQRIGSQKLRIYVHLICTDDLASLTVCLNLLLCELVFTYVYVLPVVICLHIRLLCGKYRLITYLLTYFRSACVAVLE